VDRERGSPCRSGIRPQAGGPNGGGPAPIAGAVSRAFVWLSVTVGLVFAPAAAGAAATTTIPPPQAAASSGSGGPISLTLVSQTAWVTPGQPFDIQVKPGPGAPPISRLGVSVAVYGCLSSVSGFDQSISSPGASGSPISSTHSPLALSGLPPVNGGFDLSMPVAVDRPSTAPVGGFGIDLTSTGGQCQLFPLGVYPVRIQLVDLASGQAIGGFTTHLVYSDAQAGTQKLRLAVVLPVHATLAPASSPSPSALRSDPAAALQSLSAPVTGAVTSTVSSIARSHPGVPVTLLASPQTIVSLTGPAHTAVDQLEGLASTPTIHQFAWAPFTPVNASSLVAAGLGSELARQVARGSEVLAGGIIHGTGTGTAGRLGTWFANDGMDAATLTQLQSAGYSQVVLPSGSVSSSPTNGSTAEPFVTTTSRGTPMTALVANADLTSRFTGAPGNPVLAAHQLMAEVAQIYYERPNDSSPRALVALAPAGWPDDPAFVDALLGSLADSPIVEPVTTSDLFANLPVASCRNGCRLGPAGGPGGLPVAAIHSQRLRLDGFDAAAPSARTESTGLGDVVLAGESETLRPGQQAEVLQNAGAAVDAQLAQLVVAGDPVTLTSARGTIQVTVISYAHYPVTATMTLTSDKLLFPGGTTQWTHGTTLIGSGHTNIVPVTVQARASGTSKITIVLRSPTGGLTLSSGQVSVRSTATSLVGILLSLGAVAVLVAWWIRTSRKRRSGGTSGTESVRNPGEAG